MQQWNQAVISIHFSEVLSKDTLWLQHTHLPSLIDSPYSRRKNARGVASQQSLPVSSRIDVNAKRHVAQKECTSDKTTPHPSDQTQNESQLWPLKCVMRLSTTPDAPDVRRASRCHLPQHEIQWKCTWHLINCMCDVEYPITIDK